MTVKRVYIVTTHGQSEFIPTPPRHPLCPAHFGDWTISKSYFDEKGSQHIWCCDIETSVAPKAPSKFHPHAAAATRPAAKAKPKPKPAAKKPEAKKPASAPKPEAKPAPKAAKPPKPPRPAKKAPAA